MTWLVMLADLRTAKRLPQAKARSAPQRNTDVLHDMLNQFNQLSSSTARSTRSSNSVVDPRTQVSFLNC